MQYRITITAKCYEDEIENTLNFLSNKFGVPKESFKIAEAEAFIPNPNRFPCVNHKDENKQNNNVNNLEWCSFKYNNNYGTRIKRSSLKQGKPVYQFDLKGNFIKKWESAREIERKLGIPNTNISNCCNEKIKSAAGFIWRFKERNYENIL